MSSAVFSEPLVAGPQAWRMSVLSRLIGPAVLIVALGLSIAADRWDQQQRDIANRAVEVTSASRHVLRQHLVDDAVGATAATAQVSLAPNERNPTRLVVRSPAGGGSAIEQSIDLRTLLEIEPGEHIVGADIGPLGPAWRPLEIAGRPLAYVGPAVAGPVGGRPPILPLATILSALLAASIDSLLFRARLRRDALNLAEGRLLDARAEIFEYQATSETAGRALRAAERAYQAIFDNAIEGIFQTTLDGRYLRVNRALAQIYGYDSPEALIRGLVDIAHGLYVDPARREAFARIMRTDGTVKDFQSQVRRRDGTTIWIAENAHAVRDESGRVIRYEGTVIDISARKAIEAEMQDARAAAEQANRAKSAFLATISHELKTPLNVILGFGDLLEGEVHGPLGDTRYREYTAHIRSAGARLLDAVNDVIALSQAEAGVIDVAAIPLDPLDLAEPALATARKAAEAASLTLVLAADRDLPAIDADVRLMRRCLSALLSNAMKFTPAGGQIRLEVTRGARGGVTIAVADTGIGIGPSKIAAALGAFDQGDASLGRRYEGLGVGLPLVKAIADLHGAVLHIQNGPEGGTRVALDFRPSRSEAAA